MRPLLSFVAGAVALLALLAAVPLLWISTHVADEDGYVSFSSTLAKDPELQKAFAGYLSDELSSRGALPTALKGPAASALAQVASRTSNEDGFVEAWEQTQRSFHRSAFADPTPRVLSVDVGPLGSFVAKRVTGGLPASLTVPDHLVVPIVSDGQDREGVERIKDSTRLGTIGAVVAVLAAAACVGLARRTSGAVGWLGLGVVLVSGVLWLSSGPAAQAVLDRTSAPSAFARTLQKLLMDRASDSLAAWLVVLALLGAVLAATGLVGRAVTGRRAG